MSSPPTPAAPLPPTTPLPTTLTPADRTRRQRGLFFGGLAFVIFSGLITRRSLTRRYKPIASALQPLTPGKPLADSLATKFPATQPNLGVKGTSKVPTSKPTTTPASPSPHTPGAAPGANPAEEAPDLNNSGPILAVEALTVATLNVFSWAIMLTGAGAWYFDIASIDDLRYKVRQGMGVDPRLTEQDAEEEMEEWLASVLERKDRKSGGRMERVGEGEGEGEAATASVAAAQAGSGRVTNAVKMFRSVER